MWLIPRALRVFRRWFGWARKDGVCGFDGAGWGKGRWGTVVVNLCIGASREPRSHSSLSKMVTLW